VVVVAPLTEELFFRGFVFNGLRRRLTVPGAAAVSGVLFASVHVVDAEKLGLLIPFTAIGFMFALLVAVTGSLWNSILVHFSFNLIGVVGGATGGRGVLPAIIVLVALYVLIARTQRHRQPHQLGEDRP
jgi:membrane protease YdiL (CAAX protease family)